MGEALAAAVGMYDSSKTRVAPVFNALLARDPTGRSWLPQLLSLPQLDGSNSWDSRATGEVQAHWWHGNPCERKLDPPVSLLQVLLREQFGSGRRSSISERQSLFDGDPAALDEGLRLLDEQGFVLRKWWCFEGRTSVDAVIETERLLLVVEGKRTERGDTTYTEYMPGRNQMLRNIDDAWEIRGTKQVVAFCGVEDSNPTRPLCQSCGKASRRTRFEPRRSTRRSLTEMSTSGRPCEMCSLV